LPSSIFPIEKKRNGFMNFNNLIVKKNDNGIWLITLSRSNALNALNIETLTELDNLLDQVAEKSWQEVKVLILTGAGEKAFVAGADIKEMVSLKESAARSFSEFGQKVLRKIETLRIPVLAAVNGFALGGGLELALACDFIYASQNAKLGLPEVSLGLIPGFGGTVRLSRVVGLNRAREMIMTGNMISAEEAFSFGLVNKVVPQEVLLEQVLKTAETMIQKGPIALAKAKFIIQESLDISIDSGMALEAMSFGVLFNKMDTREGLQAFIEKRKAQFKEL
jgi:enoyl-CoA hydratase